MADLAVIDGGKVPARDFSRIPPAVIAQAIFDLETRIATKDAIHQKAMEQERAEVREMRDYLASYMEREHAKAIPSDDLEITYEQRTELVKYMNVLLSLSEILPADELNKAFSATITVKVTLDQIEAVKLALASFIASDRIDVEYKADATKLKTFAKFGDAVKERLDAGLRREPVGQPVLKIADKQKAIRNVTPVAPAIGGAE